MTNEPTPELKAVLDLNWSCIQVATSTSNVFQAIGTPDGDGGAKFAFGFRYTNYRGETSDRMVVPIGLAFGATEWHPEPQWLLWAYDLERAAIRAFALRDADFTKGN